MTPSYTALVWGQCVPLDYETVDSMDAYDHLEARCDEHGLSCHPFLDADDAFAIVGLEMVQVDHGVPLAIQVPSPSLEIAAGTKLSIAGLLVRNEPVRLWLVQGGG